MIKEDCKNLESESNFSCRIYRGACDCEIDCPNYDKRFEAARDPHKIIPDNDK